MSENGDDMNTTGPLGLGGELPAPEVSIDEGFLPGGSSIVNASVFLPQVTSSQSITIGVYLVIAGLLTIVGNAAVVGALARFRSLLDSPYRLFLLHLCISDLGMAILGGFIFSGSSSLAGRWLFGDKGCQWYAFAGFLFGNANLTIIGVMTVTRCFIGLPDPPVMVTKARIRYSIYASWVWSLFWSLCPLLGWSSYDYEPSKTTCTINWKDNDTYYVSYILSLTIFVFVIPVVAMAICILISFREIRKMKAIDPSSSSSVDATGQLKGTKMCVALLMTALGCWSGYAVLCLWVVFLPPDSVPVIIGLLPPLFAKLAVLINPLIVVIYDDNLRRGAMSWLLCKDSPPELLSSPETARMTSSSNEN